MERSDNSRMKRTQRFEPNVLRFNTIPPDSLDGLVLGLPNGKTYVPMDTAQLKARLIEAIIANATIEPTTHPIITEAITLANAFMCGYKVKARTTVDNHVIELIEHPDPGTYMLLRYQGKPRNAPPKYSHVNAEFAVRYGASSFRKAVIYHLFAKTFA